MPPLVVVVVDEDEGVVVVAHVGLVDALEVAKVVGPKRNKFNVSID